MDATTTRFEVGKDAFWFSPAYLGSYLGVAFGVLGAEAGKYSDPGASELDFRRVFGRGSTTRIEVDRVSIAIQSLSSQCHFKSSSWTPSTMETLATLPSYSCSLVVN
jgi:hypothetical protein